jgi:Fe/S biogenesis protein NfuA
MRRRIQKVIEDMINPAVASHGGRVDLVDFVNNNVYLRLSGGCQGCASSSATLKNGIERLIREEFPSVGDIVDVTDHASGENPYYSH